MNDTTTKTEETVTPEIVEALAREIATVEETPSQVPAADLSAVGAASVLAMVERLALNPEVDAGKLETVMRVANGQQDREREIQFRQDHNRAIREMPVIRKDGRIVILDKHNLQDMSKARVQGHFERWPDVQAAVTPILTRNNMTLRHKIDHADGQTVVIAVLTHDNGFVEESGPMRLPLDTSGGKNNVQGAGSSQTYGMRYTTRAICGLQFENSNDDDGALTAMSDEPVNDQQQRRLEEAQRAFERGPQAYEEWFGSIPPIDRAWLIQSGRHAEFGGKAMPGQITHDPDTGEVDSSPPADQEKAPADDPNRADAEAWLDRYKRGLKGLKDLDQLEPFQTKRRESLERLKNEYPDLHTEAVAAGSEAFKRLGGDE